MTVERMRENLSKVYPSPNWRLRVNAMDDRRVIAIYRSMLERGGLKPKKSHKKKEPGIRKAIQLSIFDLPEYQQTAT